MAKVNTDTRASQPLQTEFAEFGKDAQERMADLERRISEGKKTREWAVSMLSSVKDKVGQEFDKFKGDFETMIQEGIDPEEAKKLAKYTVGNIAGITESEGGKIYRTEMTDRIEDYLAATLDAEKITAEQASSILEAGMAALSYRNGSIKQSLYDAMRMVEYGATKEKGMLIGPDKRKRIEDQMAGGVDLEPKAGKITIGGKEYQITKAEILTGAAMTEIHPQLLDKFIFQNAVIINGQVWARMKNGCEGNLVIIDIGEPEVPPTEVPPTEVPPTEEPPTEVPPTEPESVESDKEIKLYDFIDPKTHGVIARLNPVNHWIEWTDSFYKLSPDTQQQAVVRIKQEVWEKLPDVTKKQLEQMMAAMANPAVLDQMRDALKAKGAAATPDEQAFLSELDTSLNVTKERQLLGMFDIWTGVRFEERHTNPQVQADYNNLQIVLKTVHTQLEKPENARKSIDQVLSEVTARTPGYATAINFFRSEFAQFQKEPEITQFSTVDKFAGVEKASDAAWLAMGSKYRNVANDKWFGDQTEKYEQSEVLYRNILAKKLKPNAAPTQKQQEEITKKVDKEIKMDKVRSTLKERGMLDPSFWGAPERGFQTEQEFVDFVFKQSREELADKLRFDFLAENSGSFDTSDPAIAKALEEYKNMKGVGTWDLADETWKFLTKELIVNAALFAVSGGVANLALRGAVLGARALGVARLAGAAAGAGRLGRVGVGVSRFAAASTVQGAAFAASEVAISEAMYGPQVWDSYWQNAGMSTLMFATFGGAGMAMEGIANRLGRTALGRPTVGGGRVMQAHVPGILDVPVGAVRAARAAGAAGGSRIGGAARYMAAQETRLGATAGVMTGFNTLVGGEDMSKEQYAKNLFLLHFLWAPFGGSKPQPEPPKQITYEPRKQITYEPRKQITYEPRKQIEYAPQKQITYEPIKQIEYTPQGHAVDIQADRISKSAYEVGVETKVSHPLPREALIGNRLVPVDLVLTYRPARRGAKTIAEKYEAVYAKKDNGTYTNDVFMKEKMKVDRYLAERTLLSEREPVEYPTRRQAERARAGILKDYPQWNLTEPQQIKVKDPSGKEFKRWIISRESDVKVSESTNQSRPSEASAEPAGREAARVRLNELRAKRDQIQSKIRGELVPELKADLIKHLRRLNSQINQVKQESGLD